MNEKPRQPLPYYVTIIISGLGGATGWLPIHPIDICKVRLQIDEQKKSKSYKPTMRSTLNKIWKQEGLKGLYNGLSAGITRQLTYTALRLGLYDILREKIIKSNSSTNQNPSFSQKLLIGLISGGIAAGICTPIEVSLVRMQSDGAQLDINKKRNYKNIFDALFRVGKEEGIFTLWRGIKPTVARGMIVSCVQLSSYDQAKQMIVMRFQMKDGPLLHFIASLIAGYLYSLASLPLDICKTRMQHQQSVNKKIGEKLLYKSIPQTMFKIVSNEGFFALWKGFLPYFARSGGHTICMFLCVEQYKKLAYYLRMQK